MRPAIDYGRVDVEREVRAIFSADLDTCASHGVCPPPLYGFLVELARKVKGDNVEVEGFNSLIKSIGSPWLDIRCVPLSGSDRCLW